MAFHRRNQPPREKQNTIANWVPKTELGKRVLKGEVPSYEALLASGKPVLETEIIDFLLPDLVEEMLEIRSTQRMTSYGRKMLMRAVVLLGNKNGVVGVGVGKAVESRDAIAEAVKDAKKNLVMVPLGSGSWEDVGGHKNSLPREVVGKSGSLEITIKPAPRGVGIVAGKVSKKVLEMAGVKDAWTFAKGRTRNVLNAVRATLCALDSLNHLKGGVNSQ